LNSDVAIGLEHAMAFVGLKSSEPEARKAPDVPGQADSLLWRAHSPAAHPIVDFDQDIQFAARRLYSPRMLRGVFRIIDRYRKISVSRLLR
jgi:hypothetical protein